MPIKPKPAAAKKVRRRRSTPKAEPVAEEVHAPDAFHAHAGMQFGRFAGFDFAFHDEMFDGKPGRAVVETNFLGRHRFSVRDIAGGVAALREVAKRARAIDFSNPAAAFSEAMALVDELQDIITGDDA